MGASVAQGRSGEPSRDRGYLDGREPQIPADRMGSAPHVRAVVRRAGDAPTRSGSTAPPGLTARVCWPCRRRRVRRAPTILLSQSAGRMRTQRTTHGRRAGSVICRHRHGPAPAVACGDLLDYATPLTGAQESFEADGHVPECSHGVALGSLPPAAALPPVYTQGLPAARAYDVTPRSQCGVAGLRGRPPRSGALPPRSRYLGSTFRTTVLLMPIVASCGLLKPSSFWSASPRAAA